MGAAITGLGAALPARAVSNDEIGATLGLDDDWVVSRTGIRRRRIAGTGESSVSLGASAALQALDAAGIDATRLDAVIVATVSPDRRIPGTAPVLAATLGATQAFAFDLNAGCSGFLVALNQAHAMVSVGHVRRVLVCGIDILSRLTDRSDPKTAILFGDGAGAAVVERHPVDALGPFLLFTDGSEPELLWTREPGDGLIEMNGREVYVRAVKGMAAAVEAAAARARVGLDELDLVVAHQANARILRAVAERLGLPKDRFVSNIAEVGNTSAASIPMALHEAASDGLLEAGMRVMLTAFGAGFTWGAGLVRWVALQPGADGGMLRVNLSEEAAASTLGTTRAAAGR